MQRVFVHAHHAIFDPHSLEIEVKLDVILSHLWYVLLPEGEMGKSRNLLCRKAFMAQGVDSESLMELYALSPLAGTLSPIPSLS